jgi:hypothetical protein
VERGGKNKGRPVGQRSVDMRHEVARGRRRWDVAGGQCRARHRAGASRGRGGTGHWPVGRAGEWDPAAVGESRLMGGAHSLAKQGD